MPCAKEIEQEARRVLPRLSEPRTVLAGVKGKDSFGIFSARNGWKRAVVQTTDEFVKAFHSREFLVAAHPDHPGALAGLAPRLDLSDIGAAFLRRSLSGTDPFARQHQIMKPRLVKGEGNVKRTVQANVGETPLGWLRNRKGGDGAALLTAAEFEAGERFREDFTKAGLSARVTADWSLAPGTAPKRGGAAQFEITDMALAARQRFAKAVEAAGPGLNDVLIEVCCHLHGLEEAERGLNWPKRSAKVVLKIGLGRLARHYGLVPVETRKGRVRSWRR